MKSLKYFPDMGHVIQGPTYWLLVLYMDLSKNEGKFKVFSTEKEIVEYLDELYLTRKK